nr:Chain X, CYTOCHROME C-550 [Paracoccus versutus]
QEGDAAKGEKEFNKCKACHMVQAPDGTDIVKGGKTGPNLYGVVGRKIASVEGFKYGDGILEVAEKNPDMVWSEADLIEYVTDPKPWLVEKTGDSAAKTKMTFKLGKNQADVVAFLAQHSPDAGAEAAPAEGAAN